MYDSVSKYYDFLTKDIKYNEWSKYIISIIKKLNPDAKAVLDLCCGTGSMTAILSKKGYDVDGVDISSEMLTVASNKLFEADLKAGFINQDIINLEIQKKYDVVICILDSINHIIRINDLKRVFKNIKNLLNEGGILIFDINTEYKFQKKLDGNVYYQVDDDISYIWENRYNEKTKICDFDMTFFIKQGILYNKSDEKVKERCYSTEELTVYLQTAGFKNIEIYNGFTFRKPLKTSERVFFVVT
jgi:SAM-dependent methyltransferase